MTVTCRWPTISSTRDIMNYNRAVADYANIGLKRVEMEQRAAIMLGDHDDHGVDAREMLGVAIRAAAPPAGAEDRRRGPAIGAEAVARVPVDQRARRGEGRRLARLQLVEHAEQVGRAERRGRARTRHDRREARLATIEAEQHELRLVRRLGQHRPAQAAVIGHLGLEIVEAQQPRLPIAHRRRQRTHDCRRSRRARTHHGIARDGAARVGDAEDELVWHHTKIRRRRDDSPTRASDRHRT